MKQRRHRLVEPSRYAAKGCWCRGKVGTHGVRGAPAALDEAAVRARPFQVKDAHRSRSPQCAPRGETAARQWGEAVQTVAFFAGSPGESDLSREDGAKAACQRALLTAWTATLPPQPDPNCFSAKRTKRRDVCLSRPREANRVPRLLAGVFPPTLASSTGKNLLAVRNRFRRLPRHYPC